MEKYGRVSQLQIWSLRVKLTFFDHVSFGINHTPIDQLPINYALLTILYAPSRVNIEINY